MVDLEAPSLVLIAALASNGVIGKDNQLPWHLPKDLQSFKQRTLGSPIIMGRATYDSIGRLLPGRLNIIVSRNTGLAVEGAVICHSLEAAWARGAQECRDTGQRDYFVIGGAALYAASLAAAQGLCLTFVAAEPDGDVYFPAIAWEDWQEISRQSHLPDSDHAHAFDIVEYERQAPPI